MAVTDVFVARGTGNAPGPRNDMCGLVTRKLKADQFRLFDVNYPATIGRIGSSDGRGVPMDQCVEIGVQDLARQVRNSPNRAGSSRTVSAASWSRGSSSGSSVVNG